MKGNLCILAHLAKYKELSSWWVSLNSEQRAALIIVIQSLDGDALNSYFEDLNSMTSDERATQVKMAVLYQQESLKGNVLKSLGDLKSKLTPFLTKEKKFGERFFSKIKEGYNGKK